MKKALILITSLVSFGLLVGCQATSETNASQEVVAENTQVISGTVSYRERIALPENA
ncbi:lipo-like protein, partial [Vibrio splendidus]